MNRQGLELAIFSDSVDSGVSASLSPLTYIFPSIFNQIFFLFLNE